MTINGLLDGIRVLDLSQYIPGPFATRQLADLGAEVIKIEPPQGDPMRTFGLDTAASLAPVYRHLNRGKRICKLNLKTRNGRDKLTELLADADILLESYRPGVLAGLGFGRHQLGRINTRLIHCALSGYGQQGRYAARAGHDINYCALSSQAVVNGTAERPVIGFPPLADHGAALQASVAMLAALHARPNRSDGIFLDLSMTESILSWQYLPLLNAPAKRATSILDGGAACYNFYQCADGNFVSLGAIEPVFWQRFCTALEQPQWIERQYEGMPQDGLIGEVTRVISAQARAHWQTVLGEIDCCFEPLLAPDELAANEPFQSRRALSETGPNHPLWIDQQALSIATDFEEIELAENLSWNPPQRL